MLSLSLYTQSLYQLRQIDEIHELNCPVSAASMCFACVVKKKEMEDKVEKGRSARVQEAVVSISANDYRMCIDNLKPQVLEISIIKLQWSCTLWLHYTIY